MLKLILNKKKYLYRSKQSEITIAIGKELEKLKEEYPCDCNPEYQKWVLTILCGCTYDEADLVDEVQLAKLIGVHPYFANDIKVKHHDYIKINRKLYKYYDFNNSMTVDYYGNLDFLAMQQDFDNIFLSLYQPIKKRNLKYWLIYLLTKNHKTLNDYNYFRYKIALYLYFQWKEKLLSKYNMNALDDGIPDDQKPDAYVLTDLEKYGLYHVIMEICDNDYDKQENWLKRDIEELLKYTRYMNKKISIKNQQINNQQF